MTGPTSCGSPTSPSTPPAKARSTARVVLDVFSRRVVGWSIDSRPQAALATNALAMAIQNREPHGSTIHSDRLARNSPPGRSHNGPKTPGLPCRWARSGTASIMPSSSRSGPACKSSCSTGAAGGHVWSSPTPSSSTLDLPQPATAALITRHAHARRIRDPPRHHRLRPNNPTARNAGHTRPSRNPKAVHRPRPAPLLRPNPQLHGAPRRRRQDQERSHPLPQTLRRPRALPHPPSRSRHPHNPHLTSIGRSRGGSQQDENDKATHAHFLRSHNGDTSAYSTLFAYLPPRRAGPLLKAA